MSKNWSLTTRYLILGFVIIALVVIGWYVREMFQSLVIAGLIAYILNPAVDFLKQHTRMSHRLTVNLVYFTSLAILLAIPATLVPILLGDIQNLSTDLLNLPAQIQSFFSKTVTIRGFTLNLESLAPNFGDSFSSFINAIPENALRVLEATSKNAAWFLVIVVTIYYLLMDWDRVREWFIRLSPEPYREDTIRLFLEIKKVWSAYLRGQLALMFIVGCVFTIVWFAIGLPGAFILGILTGLFSLVPEIGPLVGTILAVAVALVEGSHFLPLSNFWFSVLVVAIYLVLINFKNIWLRPRVMGRSVHMHEGLVFVAIIAAVIFQGVLGALIIVPVLASAVVIGRYLRQRILGLPPFPESEPLVLETEVVAKPEPSSSRKKRINRKE